MAEDSPTAAAYLADLGTRIGGLFEKNAEAISAAAKAIENTARANGLVYIFGTGHSHMLAEEAHYRAGGLALVVPILASATMLHEGAVAGTSLERIPGFIQPILARYPIGPHDMLIVASNSGVNAAIIEAADHGRAVGATVAAITAVAYSETIAQGRKRLADLAGIVLDTGVPAGDAVVALPKSGLKSGAVSTALGAALINAVFAEAAARLELAGIDAPVYRSASLPGGREANQALIRRYRPRNPHL